MLKLNEKHIEDRLYYKDLRETAIKYNSNHKEHRYKLVDEPKKLVNRIFINEKLAIKIIMDCSL